MYYKIITIGLHSKLTGYHMVLVQCLNRHEHADKTCLRYLVRVFEPPRSRASKTGLHPIKTFCAFLSEDRPIYVLSSSFLTPSPRLRIHARLRTLQCTRFLGSRNGSETAGYTGSVALDTANMAPWDRRWQPWEVSCRADGLGSSERGSREGWRSGTAPG